MIYLLSHTILRSAERFPAQDAFRFGKRAFTYEEMVRKTHQLANLLMESGVKKGDRVGVYLNRSLETALAIYGIMQAGAAYVPLDPHAPVARTRFLLQDCGIEHLITGAPQRRSLPEILTVDSGLKSAIGLKGEWGVPSISWEEVETMPASSPPIRILEDDLAYIMYTSGSTGAPKGIMHTHRSGLNYAKLSADLYGLNAQDRLGSHAPLHFDISTLGYFSAPLAGATSVVVSDAHTKMPASLTKLMEDERLTIWYSVPFGTDPDVTAGRVGRTRPVGPQMGAVRGGAFSTQTFTCTDGIVASGAFL